jgi:hypothetical protein
MKDVKGLVAQLLAGSTRPVTIHLMTNAWDGTADLATRARLATAELINDPRVEYVPYRYCELRLDAQDGATCPPQGAPAAPLPGAVNFTRLYRSFERRWPKHDAIHPDTESYVLKLFSHAWMTATPAGAAAREAVYLDSDIDIVGDLSDILSQAPGGVLGLMRAQGAVVGIGLEMQPVYSKAFWPRVDPPVGRGYNGGIVGA